MEQLDVRKMVATVAGAVGVTRRLQSVEDMADGRVSDGVEVELESLLVEPGDDPFESLRFHECHPGVAFRASVGLEHRRRLRLNHAVLVNLHRVSAQPPLGVFAAGAHKVLDLLVALFRIPAEMVREPRSSTNE
jgi:hypothetical protein